MTLDELKLLTENAAKKNFPNETWIEVSPCVFVASSRNNDKISKNDKEKLDKETEQAKILAKENHILFLTPERSDAGKQFDGLMDGGCTFDLKKIPGNLEAVGRNFKDGAKKAEIVFLETVRDFKKQEIYRELRGELKEIRKNGIAIKAKTVLIKIKNLETYELKIEDLI